MQVLVGAGSAVCPIYHSKKVSTLQRCSHRAQVKEHQKSGALNHPHFTHKDKLLKRCCRRAQVKDVPAIKGVVRGKMGCSGWVVAPAQGGAASRVTYVSVTDLKVRSSAVPCCHNALHSTCSALAPA